MFQMQDLTTTQWIIVVIGGFSAGFIDSIAGGGGLIALPSLLFVGLSPHQALATNKLQSVCGTSVACYNYLSVQTVDPFSALWGVVCTFIGAISGSTAVHYIDAEALKLIIPVVLAIVFVYIVLGGKDMYKARAAKMNIYIFFFIFGLAVGFYDGFFGPGTGAIWMSLIVFGLGLSSLPALTYTKIMNVTSNIGALVIFSLQNTIVYHVAIVMALGQIAGAYTGSRLAIKKGSKLIRPLLLIIVAITIIKTIYDSYLK